jgi:hypothetical protein
MVKHPVKMDGISLSPQILFVIDKSIRKTNAALQMEAEKNEFKVI